MNNCIMWFSLSLFICLISCESDSSGNEDYEALVQRIQNDELLLSEMDDEMLEIDKYIREIASSTLSTEELGEAEKEEILASVKEKIEMSEEKIKSLEEKLEKSNSSFKNNKALRRSLKAQQKLIDAQNSKVLFLEGKVDSLSKENIELIETASSQGLEITNLEKIKTDLEDAIKKARDDYATAISILENKEKEIGIQNEKTKKLQDNLKKTLLGIAKNMIKTAENKKGIFKKAENERKEYSIAAFSYLCDYQKNFNIMQLDELNKLRNHPKLGKYVTGLKCD